MVFHLDKAVTVDTVNRGPTYEKRLALHRINYDSSHSLKTLSKNDLLGINSN